MIISRTAAKLVFIKCALIIM